MELSKEEKKIYKAMGTNLGIIRVNNPNGKFYSQKEIGKIINMNEPNYNSIECGNGERHLKDYQIIKLAKHYNTSADFLLGLTDIISPDREMNYISKKYGLAQKALENLKEMTEHKYFGDTILDTTNKLLEQDFYKNNDGSAIISLIDNYFEENGDGKALKIIRRNGMETTIRGQDVIKTFLLILENELINMKEGEKDECKRTRKK